MSSELVVIIDDSATQLKILERLANSLGGWTVAKAFNDERAEARVILDDEQFGLLYEAALPTVTISLPIQ